MFILSTFIPDLGNILHLRLDQTFRQRQRMSPKQDQMDDVKKLLNVIAARLDDLAKVQDRYHTDIVANFQHVVHILQRMDKPYVKEERALALIWRA